MFYLEKRQTVISKKERDANSPFFLNGGRAMVSLGPLSQKRHCPYHCAFCYVQDDFSSYVKLDIDEIVEFLIKNRDKYNIIYVSGDTDSFAPPRTQQGIKLLRSIVNAVSCDITFTTRSVFTEEEYKQLAEIIQNHKKTGYKFIAGSSITRYSEKSAYLEPAPIPSPDERIAHIKRMKKIGAITMLGLRPFLPVVDINDYYTILDKVYPHLDIALGECFYFIRNGNIQQRVFPNGLSKEYEKNITHNHKMDFDDNDSLWEIWDSEEYENKVAAYCKKLGIIFSMHSEQALKEYDNICS